jgi:hypothetical protein
MWFNDITGVYLICLFCFLQSMSFALSFVPCDVSGFNVENPGRILLCIIHYRSRTHGHFKMCTWFSIPADFHCCKGNVVSCAANLALSNSLAGIMQHDLRKVS